MRVVTPTFAMASIVTLAALLACASAAAGALWWRVRSGPREAPGDGVRGVIERLRGVEEALTRLEAAVATREASRGARRDAATGGPARRRADPPEPGPASGPTLIAVPDLAGRSPEPEALAELARRFGAIWDLADAGASPDAIARATGQPIGQVELILGLRRQVAQAGPGGRP